MEKYSYVSMNYASNWPEYDFRMNHKYPELTNE